MAVCPSLALKQMKKVWRKTTGGKSSSHVTQEENNCDRNISRPSRVHLVTGYDTHLVHKEIIYFYGIYKPNRK